MQQENQGAHGQVPYPFQAAVRRLQQRRGRRGKRREYVLRTVEH